MKIYLKQDVIIEINVNENQVVFVNDIKFTYNNKSYLCEPVQFKLDDVYALLNEIFQNNKNRLIFINRFEELADNMFVLYFAIE